MGELGFFEEAIVNLWEFEEWYRTEYWTSTSGYFENCWINFYDLSYVDDELCVMTKFARLGDGIFHYYYCPLKFIK